MMRAVFDTNTIISAQFWGGLPREALDTVREGRTRLLASEALLDELTEVLSRSKFASNLEAVGMTVEMFVSDHRALVELVEPTKLPAPVSVDLDDDAVIACAIGGNANCIVSGDKDLLRLEAYQNIPIWNVRHFLTQVRDTNP